MKPFTHLLLLVLAVLASPLHGQSDWEKKKEKSFPPVPEPIKTQITEAIPAKASATPKTERRILLFWRCEGFIHNSIPHGNYAVQAMSDKTGAFKVDLADSYDGYRFSQIKGLIGSRTGEIFVGSPHAATLYRIDTVKGKINVLNEDLVRSSDLAVDSSGDRLLVAESDPNRIVVYDLDHNDSIHLGWTLIDFPNQEDRPQSLTFLRTPKDHLMVLLGDGSKLQVYHLARGRVVHTQTLPFLARRARIHKNWIYLQAEDYIVRKKMPQSLLRGRAR